MSTNVKYTEWVPEESVLLKVTSNKGGQGRTVRVNSNQTKRWLVVSMPKMMTWGVAENIDQTTGRVSYNASLQFDEIGVNPEADEFREKLVRFDEFLIDRITENSATYWGTKKSRELVAEGFSNSLRYPLHSDPKLKEQKVKDYDKNPSLSGKIGVYADPETGGEKWDMVAFKPAKPSPVQVFPIPGTPPVFEDAALAVPKFAQVKTIMEAKVWIQDKTKCGVTWHIKQLIVLSTKSAAVDNTSCQFDAEDNEAEDEEEEAAGAPLSVAPLPAAPLPAASTHVEDDDVSPLTAAAPTPTPEEPADDDAESDDSGVYSTDDDAPTPVAAVPVAAAPIRRLTKPIVVPKVEEAVVAPAVVAPAVVKRVVRAPKKA